jgi:hypothetical protein
MRVLPPRAPSFPWVCAVSGLERCQLAVTVAASCAVGAGAGAGPAAAIDAACAGATDAVDALCVQPVGARYRWPQFLYTALGDLVPAASAPTLETAVQAMYRALFLSRARSRAAAGPGCGVQPLDGLRMTASGALVTSVCPASTGFACEAPADPAVPNHVVVLPNGMKFYAVVGAPVNVYAGDENTCPVV